MKLRLVAPVRRRKVPFSEQSYVPDLKGLERRSDVFYSVSGHEVATGKRLVAVAGSPNYINKLKNSSLRTLKDEEALQILKNIRSDLDLRKLDVRDPEIDNKLERNNLRSRYVRNSAYCPEKPVLQYQERKALKELEKLCEMDGCTERCDKRRLCKSCVAIRNGFYSQHEDRVRKVREKMSEKLKLSIK